MKIATPREHRLIVIWLSLAVAASLVAPAPAWGEVAVAPDGKLVVARGGLIARFLPNGSIDRGFGGNGYVKPATYPEDVAVKPDGEILVTGGRTVMRFETDGRLDRTFGVDGTAWAAGNHLTMLPDGSLLVAGTWSGGCGGIRGGPFYTVGSLSRLRPDGKPDSSFDGDGFVYLRANDPCGFDPSQGFGTKSYSFTAAPVVQSDDKIVAGGLGSLARFHPDGTLDSSFGGGDGIATPTVPIDDLSVLQSGKIVTGADSLSGLYATRFSIDGSPDASFGTDGVARVTVGVVQPEGGSFAYRVAGSALFLDDGRVFLAGSSKPCRGVPSRPGPCSLNLSLVRLTDSGQLDSAFGHGDGIVLADTVGSLESPDLLEVGDRLILEGSASDRAFSVSALFAYTSEGEMETGFGDRGQVLPPPIPRRCAGRRTFPRGPLYRGSPEADRISTNPNSENLTILTYGGGDEIDATRFGRHLICSGSGDDLVLGGGGDQIVSGGTGADRLFLRGGLDKGFGGIGDDLVSGGNGADRLFGGLGDDRIVGRLGNDLLVGGLGLDILRGGPGANQLFAGPQRR